jgi:hypothetical protein
MNSVLARVLADVPAFGALADVRMISASSQESMAMPMEFKFLDGRMRSEINMAQVQSPMLKQDMVVSLREIGMDRVVTLGGGPAQSTCVLYPRVKACIEMPADEGETLSLPGLTEKPSVQKTKLGMETVAGRVCRKMSWRLEGAGTGSPRKVFLWEAEAMDGFPLKI